MPSFSIAQLKRLELEEQTEAVVERATFLQLLQAQGSDPQESQARREWEVYTRLTTPEKLDVHWRELERLEKSPGVDADLKAKFIAGEREAIDEFQAMAQKTARAAVIEAAPEEDEEAPISRRRGVPVRDG